MIIVFFFFSSRRRHTRWPRDWSSDVCSSDLDDEEDLAFGEGLPDDQPLRRYTADEAGEIAVFHEITHDPGHRRSDDGFHLHRVDHDQRIALLHAASESDEVSASVRGELHEGALEGGADRPRGIDFL